MENDSKNVSEYQLTGFRYYLESICDDNGHPFNQEELRRYIMPIRRFMLRTTEPDRDLFDPEYIHDYKASISEKSIYSQFVTGWTKFHAYMESQGLPIVRVRETKRRLVHPMWKDIIEVASVVSANRMEFETWGSALYMLPKTTLPSALRIHEWAYGSQSPDPSTVLLPARPFSSAPMPVWRIEYIINAGLGQKRYTRERFHEEVSALACRHDCSVDFICFVRKVFTDTDARLSSRWGRREDSFVAEFDRILSDKGDSGREQLARYKLLKYYPPAEHLAHTEDTDA